MSKGAEATEKARDAGDKVREAGEDMRQAGRAAMGEARDAASDAKNTVSDEIAALRAQVESLLAEKVKPALSQVAEKAEQARDSLVEQFDVQASRVSDTVRERPFASIGIAMAVGYVAAMLMRRD